VPGSVSRDRSIIGRAGDQIAALMDPMSQSRVERPLATTLKQAMIGALFGLLAAALIGWGTGLWPTAIIYGGILLTVVALATAWSINKGGGAATGTSRNLLQAAIESQSSAIAITDSTGRLICANMAYGQLCGGFPAPLDLATGATDSRERLFDLLDQARRGRSGRVTLRATAATANAGLRFHCRPGNDRSGHLVWFLTPLDEESTRQAAVSAAQGDIGRWLALAGHALIVVSDGGQILAAGPLPASMEGMDVGRFIGKPLAEMLRVNETGQVLLTSTDGASAPVTVAQSALQAGPGRQVVGHVLLMSLSQDESLPPPVIAPEQLLISIIETLPVNLALTDRDGRFITMGRGFLGQLGFKRAEPPRYPSDLVIDEEKASLAEAVRKIARRTDDRTHVTVRLKDAPDDPVQFLIESAPPPLQRGVILSMASNAEQRKLEQQVTQANKMNAIGQLAGGIAHDFNNILTAIIGFCDLLLQRHSAGDPSFSDINQIRDNANRAANLVRQLLAFSRRQTLRPQIISITDVLDELANLVNRLIGEKIRLNLVHGRSLGRVRADPHQMEQVIINLAVNARDAMPEGGTLTVTTRAIATSEVKALARDIMADRDYVEIEVADTGSGIAPELRDKIFEPFFTTKDVGKGTGLGLATVYGIVKQTDGYVFADASATGGARFRIYLPVFADAAELAALEEAKPAAGPEPVEDLWGRGTILLVEDEDAVRTFARRALERKGYTVLDADCGEAALEILAQNNETIDLLITDVIMPNMDGPTLVDRVRQTLPDLKIIYISGYAQDALRQSVGEDEAAFLPKPFSLKQLAEKVKLALADKPPTVVH
jgi:two-component system, cell cycle sensor histidine kinase and response regulator CckA